VIRVIPFGIPNHQTMLIPEAVMAVAGVANGLVLITGAAGSGKSTTLACVIDRINETRSGHIITLEDPIEYLHRNKKSLISQREVSLDSQSYVTALHACLRQSPDVILLGEMRDLATIQTALTAAETGHMVLSTLHTLGAANSIDRVIDVFPPAQQQQIRIQLSMLLVSVVSQQLVPGVEGRLLPVFEIMHVNSAVKNMIREAKVHQLDSVIASSAGEGMISMDTSLLNLYRDGKISKETAVSRALNSEILHKRINALG
jgi:twitching motility protein PilT